MARKTTKLAATLIKRHNESVIHYSKVLKLKREESSFLNPIFDDMSEDEIMGRLYGIRDMMENVLHCNNCYHGFFYIDEDGNRTSDPAEHHNWRVQYISTI